MPPPLQRMKSVPLPSEKGPYPWIWGKALKAKQSDSDNETASKTMLFSDKRQPQLHLSI